MWSNQYRTLMTDSNMLMIPAGYASDNNKKADRTALRASSQTNHQQNLCLSIPIIFNGPSGTQLLISHLLLSSQSSLTLRSSSSPTGLTSLRTCSTSGTRNRHRRHRSRAVARYCSCHLHHAPLVGLEAHNALFKTLALDGGFCCHGGCGTYWAWRRGG